jgi:ribosomal protein S18 acetylase RimI-like enzyme
METDIRPMTPDDIPAALRVWQEAPGVVLRDADRPVALTRYLRRNPGCSFVAVAGGEVVGVALAGHDGRRGYLHHVAVAAAWQRRGIGRRLVGHCLTALKAEQIDKVLLFVRADNAAGRAFWKHNGWCERPDAALMSIILGESENA